MLREFYRDLLRSRSATASLAVVLFALLAAWCFAGFVRGAETPLVGSPGNAFFDMDVERVIVDWTTWGESLRPRTHPLYKYVALIGIPLKAALPTQDMGEAATRLFCIAGLLLTGLALMVFLHRMTGSVGSAVMGFALFGASYATVLLAAIPDTSAVAGLFSILPFAYLLARRGKPFNAREAAIWAVIGVGGYAVTISQVVHTGLAAAWRAATLEDEAIAERRRLFARRTGLAAAIFLVLVVVLTEVQQEIFPGTEKHYDIAEVIQREGKFIETDQLAARPHVRFAKLVQHFAWYNFIAPVPVVEKWNPPRDTRHFYSVTIVDENLRNWNYWQAPLVASHFMLLALALRFCWKNRCLVPLCVAIQFHFFLHYFYGREFIIYAPHWQVLLVAAALSAAPRWEEWPRGMQAWLAVHVLALALHNTWTVGESFAVYHADFPKDFVPEIRT